MSNQTVDPITPEMTVPAVPTTIFTDSAPIGNHSSDYSDEIAANDLTSRANYVYALLAALALLSACFLVYGFVQSRRARRRPSWAEAVLLVFCVSQLLVLLLSLSSLAYRPRYLETSRLGCAALSFSLNAASLCGILLLVLMCYALTFDPPSQRPGVCAALAALAAVVSSLLLAALRGPGRGLGEREACVIDLAEAGGRSSYAIAKLCVGFLLPYALLLGVLIGGCVRQWKSGGRFLSGSEERPVFLAVAAATFAAQAFYSAALVRAAGLAENGGLSHGERAFLSVAELVLFSGSGACLVLVLLLHRPSRESLRGAGRRMGDCCRGLGGTRTHGHILAPRIEISGTQRDGE